MSKEFSTKLNQAALERLRDYFEESSDHPAAHWEGAAGEERLAALEHQIHDRYTSFWRPSPVLQPVQNLLRVAESAVSDGLKRLRGFRFHLKVEAYSFDSRTPVAVPAQGGEGESPIAVEILGTEAGGFVIDVSSECLQTGQRLRLRELAKDFTLRRTPEGGTAYATIFLSREEVETLGPKANFHIEIFDEDRPAGPNIGVAPAGPGGAPPSC